MKIALVTPNWKENPYPPLGLAYIGAVLEKGNDKVKIFDLTLDPEKPLEHKIEDILRFSPDVVGISAMSHNYGNALFIASILKKMDCKIVFGGPHPTIMPEEILKKEFIDFVVIGEGEETFSRLCHEIDGSNNYKDIDGLCYKENGDINIQPRKNYIIDLDKIPFPARHLLDLDKYKLMDDFGNKMVTILSSRGCPYRCTYCFKGLFGIKYRQRSSNNIVEEIRYCVNEYGYKSFYFIDDLFTLDIKRVKDISDKIKELDITWQCLARVNNATYEMFRQMKKSGCYKVHFGIESGNQRILDGIKKGIVLDQIKNAVSNCKKAEIRTKGYFMLGMPGDTIQTMNDTIYLASHLELDDAMFSITTPFPGTELWQSIDKNKIKSFSDAFYFSSDNDKINIFYNMSNVSDQEVINMMKKAKKISESKITKTYCERTLGKKTGFLAWQFTKIPGVKKAGRLCLGIKN